MTYRSTLDAALSRISALEAENKRLKEQEELHKKNLLETTRNWENSRPTIVSLSKKLDNLQGSQKNEKRANKLKDLFASRGAFCVVIILLGCLAMVFCIFQHSKLQHYHKYALDDCYAVGCHQILAPRYFCECSQ